MDSVIAADGEGVTVTGGNPDFEVGANGFKASGHSGRAAVDGVEAKSVHVVGETGRATDPGDDDEVFALNAEFGKDGLHGGEDGVVAAAGAPADFLVGLKVLLAEDGKGSGGHDNVFSVQNALLEELGEFLLELGLLEWAALNLVEANGIHQKFCAQEPEELAHVELGDEHLLVAL